MKVAALGLVFLASRAVASSVGVSERKTDRLVSTFSAVVGLVVVGRLVDDAVNLMCVSVCGTAGAQLPHTHTCNERVLCSILCPQRPLAATRDSLQQLCLWERALSCG